MATSTYLSIIDYLKTTYHPDREYVDGQLVERNVGKWEHARIQALLTAWFIQHESAWSIQTATELRTRTGSTKIRIPDVLLVGLGPQPDVIDSAPVLAVEILSEGDTYAATQEKSREYLAMGAAAIWIINPMNRTGKQWDSQKWVEVDRLEVPGTAIYVELANLFQALDGRDSRRD